MARQSIREERAQARTIGPLRGLWSFLRPYRGTMLAALAWAQAGGAAQEPKRESA